MSMLRAQDCELMLDAAVELRSAKLSVVGARSQTFHRLERAMVERVGSAVPKRVAASVLGVSVQAIDAWMTRGAIPVARRAGSTRTYLDTQSVLELACEVRELQAAGQHKGVLATGIERVVEDRAVQQNLLDAFELARFQTGIAAGGSA